MISIGEKIQTGFTVKVILDGGVKEMLFNELLTQPAIVSVYMRNNTGSCDRQVASLVEHAEEFVRAGYRLIGLSRDTAGSHLKYGAKQGVPFELVSDPKDLFATAAGSMVEKSMYGRKFVGPARAAFVLETDGTVRAVVEKVDSAKHAAQLKALLGIGH